MPFSISSGEFLVIFLVIMLVVGPSRLPAVAKNVTRFVKRARVQLTKWRQSLDSEIGDDFKQVDLTKLDPRLYDPRRLVREAVQEEMDEWKKLMNPLGDFPSSNRPRPGVAPIVRNPPTSATDTEAPGGRPASPETPAHKTRIRASAAPTMRTRGRNLRRQGKH